MAQHILKVEVNEVGRAALTLEAFYASELPPFLPDAVAQEIADLSDLGEEDEEEDEEEGGPDEGF